MIKTLLLIIFVSLASYAKGGKLHGTITNEKAEILAFSSISVQGRKTGASANNQGNYFLQLEPGTYTIICRHVGFERQEKTITIANEDVQLDFVLKEQTISLKEVIVKAGAEDPAYAIIRKTMAKRQEYLTETNAYQCEVYSKGMMSFRDYPDKFMGEKVDMQDGDTSKKKMIYLSETVSLLSVDKPGKLKIDVLSTRVSGQRNGFGFAGATFFSFYENNIRLGNALNPRGFISPIAENAFHFYRYKYEGAFAEEGKLINKIKVIPKRNYEPCFSGYINIVEDEWRIHSLQFMLTKQNQMALADTLRIEQLYQLMGANEWMPQSQVLYPAIKIFGFDMYGSFANVYSSYNLHPSFSKRFFGNTILKYEEGSNKKSINYWDSIRPLPLTTDEKKDYVKKDSLEKLRSNPRYLDSLDKINNKIKLNEILVTGKTFSTQRKKITYSVPSVLMAVGFTPVEGMVIDAPVTIRKEFAERKNISFIPHLRYGFKSESLYGWGTVRYRYGKNYYSNFAISAGRRVFQFNNENPFDPLQNAGACLFDKNNFMKIYAADYGSLSFVKVAGSGFGFVGNVQYQNRKPLENITNYSWKKKGVAYSPNFPTEILSANFQPHKATIFTLEVFYQPGSKYIEFPEQTINVGSRWPLINLRYTKGIKGLFGSDVDYDKWQCTVTDKLNLKLAGQFNYKLQTGGFLNNKHVQVQDMKHFPGNRIYVAEDYLSVFQLPAYYRFSNTAKLYGAVFAEHHFNGFLTNKIPGFRKLNWHLVAGSIALTFNKQSYLEWHVGIENILRIIRIDVVAGCEQGKRPVYEIRTGMRMNILKSND